MERKENSLVPEWWRGGACGAGGTLPFSHPSFHQDGSGRLNSPSHRNSKSGTSEYSKVWDYDSLPYTSSEGELYSSLYRPPSSRGGLSDKSNPDLDNFSRSKISLFGQNHLYHSNESLDRDMSSRVLEHGRSYDNGYALKEQGIDQTSAFTAVNSKDKGQETLEFSSLHGLNSDTTMKHIMPLRRVQSMGASHGLEGGNEEKAFASLGAHLDGVRLASTRALTPPALSSATSEFILGAREAEEKYASSGLATRSHLIGSNNTSMREITMKSAEELSATSGVTPLRPMLQTLRLEELEMRQSRQLVPMIPSFPKTMVGSPREKLKPKVTRTGEMSSPIISKGIQAISHSTGVAHRPIVQSKLTVLRSNKEAITPGMLSNGGTERLNANSVVFLGNSGGKLMVDSVGISQLSGAHTSSTSQRKEKELLDKRSVLSPFLYYGAENAPTQQPKELFTIAEDKRFSSQAKKRTDFFNTLRRQAAESGHEQSNFGRSDSVLEDKTQDISKRSEVEVSSTIPESQAGIEATTLHKSGIKNSKDDDGDGNIFSTDNASKLNIITHSDNHDNSLPERNNDFSRVVIPSNGVIVDDVNVGILKSPVDDFDETSGSATNYEEEEEAFMRSLGWVDNVEEDEALTEEEINAFYKQYGEILANKSRSFQCKQSLKDIGMPAFAESPSICVSTDLSSSEAESDGELHE